MDKEIIFSVGDTDVKISKSGHIHIKANKGTASFETKNGPSFGTTSTSWVDIGFNLPLPTKTEVERNQESIIILQAIKDLAKEVRNQRENLSRLIALVSKMYQDNEINKDTFNRLDQFLHDWLDSEIK